MKYRNCMIAYDFGGSMRVGPHPDETGWSDKYEMIVGSCYLVAKKASDLENHVQMLLEFHHAVVRDGVSVAVAHKAFLAIDEYKALMAEDVET